jgi:flagellar motor switch/type III secretory pathway protein FliN
MTQEVRFGWLGESRRTALHALLAALVEDWAHGWWIGAADGAIEINGDENDGNQDKRNKAWVSSSEAGTLAFYSGAKDAEAVGRFLAGTASDADMELAQRVGDEALHDLAMRIQRRAGINKASPLLRENAPLAVEYARLGAFRVTAMIGRLQLGLAIDRHLADRLTPPAAPARDAALVPRQAAIQRAPLKLLAVMDFGSVDLAHLSDLAIGEVLIGDRKLDEPLQIHLQGHGVVAAGYLRRLGEQRAIVLDNQHPQNTPHQERQP